MLKALITVYPKKYAHGFSFVVVIHWLIFPYPSGLLHWHCGNLTIAPVPAKQPWWIWINTSCEFIMNDCITTTKQSTTKPCAYFLGYTVNLPEPEQAHTNSHCGTRIIRNWSIFWHFTQSNIPQCYRKWAKLNWWMQGNSEQCLWYIPKPFSHEHIGEVMLTE